MTRRLPLIVLLLAMAAIAAPLFAKQLNRINRPTAVSTTSAALAGTPAAAQLGVIATMTVEGTRQPRFKGETIRGRQSPDRIPVLAFDYAIASPRDIATGQASGKRQHQPVRIVKEWGASTP